MSILGFIILLIVAAICGGIGQSIAGYSLGGCLVSAVVGFIGAYLGMWLADQFGLPQFFTVNVDGEAFPIIWSILGSILFTVVIGAITRPSRR